jgi:hypothetical protein
MLVLKRKTGIEPKSGGRGRIVLDLVRRVRRRLFHNELLAQGANASSAAVLALILLLLLGTQVLDWRWILLVSVAAGAAGLYRARRRVPSEYSAAQLVDRRMGLADSLSTAVYFSESNSAKSSEDVRRLQFQRAEKVSERVDARTAVPYHMPRTAYLLAVLLLVAGSLFALRYGISKSLDLKPPLASMLPFHFGSHDRTEIARNMRRQPPKPGDSADDNDAATDPGQSPAGDPDASDSGDNPSDPQTDKATASKGQAKPGDKGSKNGNSDEEGQAEQNGDSQNGENSAQQGNKQDSKQASASNKQESGNSGENSSFMSKVKDMMQNLLSSVKPPQSNPGSQQQQNADANKQPGKSQQNSGKQQGKNGEQQNNGNQGDSQDGQPGEQAQSPQDPQSKGDGKSDSQQASKQPGSGIGNQNGDKSIKQAEDLAAMGKLTEILGKRSANITGEATVEVQATSQQLHTPYAQRAAQHGQNGAQINRDEIPIAMEAYVQQYFEQVRKQAGKK